MDIKDTVQQMADAIAAVLRIEVEIADNNLIRIAGTGKTKSGVLQKMEGDLVYQSAIRTMRSAVIENPGFNEICEHCIYYRGCAETGEICVPIVMDDDAIGVIGLLAFDERQKKRLFTNTDDILNFLYKMSALLASKLREHEMMVELRAHSERFYQITNMVDQGIIILGDSGSIKYLNEKARILLDVKSVQEVSAESRERIFLFVERAQVGEKVKFTLNVNRQNKGFLAYCHHIIVSSSTPEKMIVIQDIDDIQWITVLTNEDQREAFKNIIGESIQIRELKEYAYKISKSASTILIQGESGTGKEEFARAIHYASDRRKGPLVTINCGAIPEHLLESELFGYEPGSFTGAVKGGKKGKFELANTGTIFMDEIGEMQPSLQVKLLRAIQQREIERLGGIRPIPIDVRIVAATNKDIKRMVETGKFREDLFYRLNVIPVMLPPLRNRYEDIIALTQHFIELFNDQFHASVLGIGQDVKEAFLAYGWPGNVRELKNVIEYLFNFVSQGYITMDNAGRFVSRKISAGKMELGKNREAVKEQSFSLDAMERELVKNALAYVKTHGGTIEDAGNLLGIGRATLFRKIKKFNL